AIGNSRTRKPRVGSRSTNPSFSNSPSASRSGVRETPSRWAKRISRRRSPGVSAPARIISRNRAVTVAMRDAFGSPQYQKTQSQCHRRLATVARHADGDTTGDRCKEATSRLCHGGIGADCVGRLPQQGPVRLPPDGTAALRRRRLRRREVRQPGGDLEARAPGVGKIQAHGAEARVRNRPLVENALALQMRAPGIELFEIAAVERVLEESWRRRRLEPVRQGPADDMRPNADVLVRAPWM